MTIIVGDGRGPAVEWYDALIAHFRHSRNVRLWFVQNILFTQPSRLSEYLLESPSSEVRVHSLLTTTLCIYFSIFAIFVKSSITLFDIMFNIWRGTGL